MIKLNLIGRNIKWLSASIPLREKILQYPRMVIAIFFKRKRISYLNQPFEYDNRFTPLNIQIYPHEIETKILSNMEKPPKSVLDIGGNIGQFITTLAYYCRGLEADVFEPNPEILTILKQNVSGYKDIRVFNYGVGRPGKINFYYEPGRSAIGGVIKRNAGKKQRVTKLSVELTDDVYKLTKRKKYDLIKIDVEGYEFETLKYLADNVHTRYLFIEISGVDRKGKYHHSELFKQIEKSFGQYEILNITALDKQYDVFDLLLKII